ncbi:MAG TPA: ADP-ribosyltransferase [Verrucomicrobium sp.]|nr:ADP-ribosyltransferase [Verrucomicrobium sp.]
MNATYGKIAVTQSDSTQAPSAPTADSRLKDLEDKHSSRGVGGRFVAWVKFKVGDKSSTVRNQRELLAAVKEKLHNAGSKDDAATLIRKELDMGKPLSARKVRQVIDSVDYAVSKVEGSAKSNQAVKTRNDSAKAKFAAFQADYDTRTAKGEKVDKPFKKPLEDVPLVLSVTAVLLHDDIAARLESLGIPDPGNAATKAILNSVGLADRQDVQQSHKDMAEVLIGKYKEAVDADNLYQSLGPRYPKYFESTFKNIVKNDAWTQAQALDVDELVAINAYTQIDYAEINSSLRDPKKYPMAPENQVITDLCIQGLSKLPPFVGTVFRGTNLPEDKDKQCVDRAVMTDAAFTSTSATKPFDGTHHFEIDCTGNGRDVSFLSEFPDEGEVLFPPGQQFGVLQRQGKMDYASTAAPQNHGVRVVLAEITNP